MKFVIISGGRMEDAFALSFLENQKYDCLMAADSGMDFLYRNSVELDSGLSLNLIPDVIAGDFDSVNEESLAYFSAMPEVEILKLNPIKDDTDTEFVLREAIRRGATSITLLGATGTRLDHVLANVNLLGIGLETGVEISLVDAHNRIRMIQGTCEIRKAEQFGDFVSLIPVKGDAKGITLKGFKYPLEKADVACFSSLCVSNEIVDEVASVEIGEGIMLLIEARE